MLQTLWRQLRYACSRVHAGATLPGARLRPRAGSRGCGKGCALTVRAASDGRDRQFATRSRDTHSPIPDQICGLGRSGLWHCLSRRCRTGASCARRETSSDRPRISPATLRPDPGASRAREPARARREAGPESVLGVRKKSGSARPGADGAASVAPEADHHETTRSGRRTAMCAWRT